MRARHLALGAVLLLTLSGCDIVLASQQGSTIEQSDVAAEATATAAITVAKTAAVAYTVAYPGKLPTEAELADFGYAPIEGVTISVAGSAEDLCIQGTTEAGPVYHSELNGTVEDGPCS